MLTSGMLALNGAGRVLNTTAAPTGGGNGYTPTGAGSALALLNAAPDVYTSGTPYAFTGQVCGAESAPAFFHMGIGFTPLGKLSCDSAGAIAFYNDGLPFTAAGSLAITTAIGP